MQIGRVGVGDLLLGVFVDALTTWWWVIIAVLALGILSLFAPKRRGRRRRKFRRENPRRTPPSHTEASRSDASRLGDPKAQMEFIFKVDFEPLRLLNRSEYRILQILEKVTREIGERHRVMAQTSLGEIIAPRAASASENLITYQAHLRCGHETQSSSRARRRPRIDGQAAGNVVSGPPEPQFPAASSRKVSLVRNQVRK